MNAKEVFDKAMQIIAIKDPVIYLVLKNLDIYYIDEDVEDRYAMTDGKQIFLFRSWLKREKFGRVKTLMHEAMHIILKHAIRAEKVIEAYKEQMSPETVMKIYGIACDAVVDFWIKVTHKGLEKFCNVPDWIEDIEKKSAEDIFQELIKLYKQNKKFAKYINEMEMYRFEFGGVEANKKMVLNVGSNEIKEVEGDKVCEVIDKIFRQAVIVSKAAGNELTGFERYVLDLMKPKVNWKIVLKRQILSWLRKNVVGTWNRPSRKDVMFKGYRELGDQNLWIFIDVSGSISDKELRSFLSEATEIVRVTNGKIRLIFWDTRVSEAIVRSRRDVEKIRNIVGGGGTVFKQAIVRYAKEIGLNDCIVVFTDCYWFDVEEALETLRKIKAFKVLVRTAENKEIEESGVFDKIVEYEVE